MNTSQLNRTITLDDATLVAIKSSLNNLPEEKRLLGVVTRDSCEILPIGSAFSSGCLTVYHEETKIFFDKHCGYRCTSNQLSMLEINQFEEPPLLTECDSKQMLVVKILHYNSCDNPTFNRSSKLTSDSYDINLSKLIPDTLKKRLNQEIERLLMEPPSHTATAWISCWPIILRQTNEDIIIQSCRQYLSFKGCIISTLWFGLSLIPAHGNPGPITSKSLAYKYLKQGLDSVIRLRNEVNLCWLLETHNAFWQLICRSYIRLCHLTQGFSDFHARFAMTQLE
ncbi:MAG: hypothetical protein SVW51_15050 [Pseudomonadota bacterium]|nr:hypothetical protein [Pseudomonadota bacterium]